MKKEVESILELLNSENTEDKILATILLGRMGKNNIKHLFKIMKPEMCVGDLLQLKGTVSPVRIISINDCQFWLGGTVLNLIHEGYNHEKTYHRTPVEFLNYE